jgi:hypothetical protein
VAGSLVVGEASATGRRILVAITATTTRLEERYPFRSRDSSNKSDRDDLAVCTGAGKPPP